MRLLAALVLLLLVSINTAFAEPTVHDRHHIFDNSQSRTSAYHSEGSFIAPSQLELSNDKLPIDSSHFLSPPNSLRLKWTSAPGGMWRAIVRAAERRGVETELAGDTLRMWVYAEDDIPKMASPR